MLFMSQYYANRYTAGVLGSHEILSARQQVCSQIHYLVGGRFFLSQLALQTLPSRGQGCNHNMKQTAATNLCVQTINPDRTQHHQTQLNHFYNRVQSDLQRASFNVMLKGMWAGHVW